MYRYSLPIRRNIRKNLLRSESSFKSFAFAKDLHAKDAKEWPFFSSTFVKSTFFLIQQDLIFTTLLLLFMISLFWLKDGREEKGELSVLLPGATQCSYSTVQLQLWADSAGAKFCAFCVWKHSRARQLVVTDKIFLIGYSW